MFKLPIITSTERQKNVHNVWHSVVSIAQGDIASITSILKQNSHQQHISFELFISTYNGMFSYLHITDDTFETLITKAWFWITRIINRLQQFAISERQTFAFS